MVICYSANWKPIQYLDKLSGVFYRQHEFLHPLTVALLLVRKVTSSPTPYHLCNLFLFSPGILILISHLLLTQFEKKKKRVMIPP